MSSAATTKSHHLDNWFSGDDQFDLLYPDQIQVLANKHWTKLNVIQNAVQFLVPEDNVRVLDIGSGVGKFCLSAAYYRPSAFYYGIEQRKDLNQYAQKAKNILGLSNVSFVHGNFTQLNLKQYDHFYFYNSFFENIAGTEKIDNTILYSESLFEYYNLYLCSQLEEMPAGTRIVTYCSLDEEIPPGYHLIETRFDKSLKYWIKK